MAHGLSVFAQAGGNSSPYTFKYVLKPKYKTRSHLRFKPTAFELREKQQADSLYKALQLKPDSIAKSNNSIVNQIKELQEAFLEEKDSLADLKNQNHRLNSEVNRIDSSGKIRDMDIYKKNSSNIKIEAFQVVSEAIAETRQTQPQNDSLLANVKDSIDLQNRIKQKEGILKFLSDSEKSLSKSLHENSLHKDSLSHILSTLNKNIKANNNSNNKKIIPQYLKNFFEIIFLGTGYNRNFTMADVIHDDTLRHKYDPAYNPVYWRLDSSKDVFRPFDITKLINPPDTILNNNNFVGALKEQSDEQPKPPPLLHEQQSLPRFKFNPETQMIDEVDYEAQDNFTPSNNLVFPTWKRMGGLGNSDTALHQKYLKYKYGVDVLYKKDMIAPPGPDTAKTVTKVTVSNIIAVDSTAHLPHADSDYIIATTTTVTATYTIPAKITGSLASIRPVSVIATDTMKIKRRDFSESVISMPPVTTLTINPTSAAKNVYTPYSIVGKGNTTLSHPIMKCYVVSKAGSDSLLVVPWFRKHVAKRNNKNNLKLLKNKPNHDYSDSLVFEDKILSLAPNRYEPNPYQDTFYVVIPNNFNTQPSKNSNYNKFNLVFNGKYLIPISIPFQDIGFSFRKAINLQSNFLNAGMAYGWAHGKTTFFKNDQIAPKNFYMGTGFVAALASATDNTNNKIMVPAFITGVHIGVAISSVQILAAGGYGFAVQNVNTAWGKSGAPWVGFGVGLSLFNVAIPSVSSGGGGGAAGK